MPDHIKEETPDDAASPETELVSNGAEAVIVDEATEGVLRLHLDMFEGPFEVLLYLIKVQEIDIVDIPIVAITEQYLGFLELMREEDLDVTGEFLLMAATLIQIKSRMLLPPDHDPEDEEEEFEEEDPRIELVEKLIEYRRYRDVAARLEYLEGERARWFMRNSKPEIEPEESEEEELLEVTLFDLIEAFRGVVRFFTEDLFHSIQTEEVSVDEKIEYIENSLKHDGSLAWNDLLGQCRSRVELVCCFLAILELCRMGRLRAHQHGPFGDIRLFAAGREPVA